MDEVKRVISYIRSCREAGIDATITIDKSRSHLVLNALEKSTPKKPNICNMTTVCPECGEPVKRCYSYCHDCGQHIDWDRR